MNSSEIGYVTELYALAYLLHVKHFEFIGFQLSLGGVSIDLLMRMKESLVIFEVKTSARGFFYSTRISQTQIKRLKRAAQFLRRQTSDPVLIFEIRVKWGEVPKYWPIT